MNDSAFIKKGFCISTDQSLLDFYQQNTQVGLTRVITDKATFAYICEQL